MLTDLKWKIVHAWRSAGQEPDQVKRWFLRMEFLAPGLLFLLVLLCLLLGSGLRPFMLVLQFLTVGALGISIASVVRRAQNRLIATGSRSGAFRALLWSFIYGDAAIKMAYIVTALWLASASLYVSGAITADPPDWVHRSTEQLELPWCALFLFAIGLLPKDRFLSGTRPPSTERKIAWAALVVISGMMLATTFAKLQAFSGPLGQAALLAIPAIYGVATFFGLGVMMLGLFDRTAMRRLKWTKHSGHARVQ